MQHAVLIITIIIKQSVLKRHPFFQSIFWQACQCSQSPLTPSWSQRAWWALASLPEVLDKWVSCYQWHYCYIQTRTDGCSIFGMTVYWSWHWNCAQKIVCSIPTCSAFLSHLGQAIYRHACLSATHMLVSWHMTPHQMYLFSFVIYMCHGHSNHCLTKLFVICFCSASPSVPITDWNCNSYWL